jgi:uncharacterized membrane protein
LPGLLVIKDVRRASSGDISRYKWIYFYSRMRFAATTEITKNVPNQRIVIKDHEGIQGTQTISFLPADEDTRMTVEVDYTIPILLFVNRIAIHAQAK